MARIVNIVGIEQEFKVGYKMGRCPQEWIYDLFITSWKPRKEAFQEFCFELSTVRGVGNKDSRSGSSYGSTGKFFKERIREWFRQVPFKFTSSTYGLLPDGNGEQVTMRKTFVPRGQSLR